MLVVWPSTYGDVPHSKKIARHSGGPAREWDKNKKYSGFSVVLSHRVLLSNKLNGFSIVRSIGEA